MPPPDPTLLDDLAPSDPHLLDDLTAGGGKDDPRLLDDIADRPRDADVRAARGRAGLARFQQLQSGQAFDAGHPEPAALTQQHRAAAARAAGIPTSQAAPEDRWYTPTARYATALGQGFEKGATKLDLALGLGSDEHLQGVLDTFEPGAQHAAVDDQGRAIGATPSRGEAAGLERSTGFNPFGDGGPNVIAPASEVGELADPSLALLAAPGGAEAYALVQGAESRQAALRAGHPENEAWQAAVASAMGNEVGFRGAPALAPELAKLSPRPGVPIAQSAAEGSLTGRAAEGALMGAAPTAAEPADGSKQKDLSGTALMAALALGGGRATAAIDADGRPMPSQADPAAVTQELGPVTSEAARFPEPSLRPRPGEAGHQFQPGEAPADVPYEESPEDRQRFIDQSQAKVEDVKRIRATGEPVVGPERTREIDPAAVRTAVDAEDAYKTVPENEPNRLMNPPDQAEATRSGDTQDNLKTPMEGASVLPTRETDILRPVDIERQRTKDAQRNAYRDALADNVASDRAAQVDERARERLRTERKPALDALAQQFADGALTHDEYVRRYDETLDPNATAFEDGYRAPAAGSAAPARPAPREAVPAPTKPETSHGVPTEEILPTEGIRRTGSGRAEDQGTGQRADARRPVEGQAEGRADAQREDARPHPEGNPEGAPGPREAPAVRHVEDRAGREHALVSETGEGRDIERKVRRETDNPYEGKGRNEIHAAANKRADSHREEILRGIEERFQSRENYRNEGERVEAQKAAARELHEATKSGDPRRIARARDLYNKEHANRSLLANTLGVGVRNAREATPRERHEMAVGMLQEAHSSRHQARIAKLEKTVEELRASLPREARSSPIGKPETRGPQERPDLAPKRRQGIQRKKAALNEEFKALAKALGKNIGGQGPSNALGGRALELIYQMLENRVKHGALSFADAVLAISDHVLAVRHNPDAHKALDAQWEKIQQRYPNAEAPEGKAADIIADDPRFALDKRMERMDAYYKRLEAHYQDYHDQLAAMTPEERADFLAGEASRADLPESAQQIREEGATRLRELREKIKALNGEDAPVLQDQLDEEGRRLANLHGRLETERQRLAAMTPDELLAEARQRKAGPAPEIAQLRAEAAKKRQEVLADLNRLKNPDSAYREGATDVPLPPDMAKRQSQLKRLEKKLEVMKQKDTAGFQKVVEKMRQRGFPIDDTNAAWLKDPTLMGAFQSALNGVTKGGLGAIAAEWWRAALHFSGQIPIMKVASDIAQFGYTELSRALSSHPAEVLAAWKGLLPGIQEGGKLALSSLKWERDRFRDVHDVEGDDNMHGITATPGKVGRAVRLFSGLTPVAAFNAFASSIYARMEVGAQAVRRAKAAKAADVATFVHDEIMDPQSESWAAASRLAERRTFTEKNPAAQFLNYLKRMDTKHPLFDYPVRFVSNLLFPFTTIPSNVLKKAVFEHTPLFQTIGSLYRWKMDPDFRLSEEAAHHALTWGTLLGMSSVVDQKDSFGNPRVTGFAAKKNPASLRVAGHYVSYAKFGPVAHGLGAIVDMLNAYKKGGDLGDQATALKHHITEEAFLRSIADVIEAFDTPTDQHGNVDHSRTARYAANLTTSLVPALVRQVRAATDDNEEQLVDRRDKGFGSAYVEDAKRNLGIHIVNKYDAWGEVMKKDSFEGQPLTTFLWRVLSPARLGEKIEAPAPIDLRITDWNASHPKNELHLYPPSQDVRLGTPRLGADDETYEGGKVYKLSEEQREEALRTAGPAAQRELSKRFANAPLTPATKAALEAQYNSYIHRASRLIAERDATDLPETLREQAKNALTKLAAER